MPKITEYPQVQEMAPNDVFLLDGENGTKTITAQNLQKQIQDSFVIPEPDPEPTPVEIDFWKLLDDNLPLGARRNCWRGKRFSTGFTDAQSKEVRAGTFKDLFIGDYWYIGGVIWRIVDMDYWFDTSTSPVLDTHHLVIMPDNALYDKNMNTFNVTTGGYVGSDMYKSNLETAKSKIKQAFPNHILPHKDFFVNEVTNGYPSKGSWYSSEIELPNEIMIYGSYIMSPSSTGSYLVIRNTIDKSQLSAMKLNPSLMTVKNKSYWLRDVVSDKMFAVCYDGGIASASSANNDNGVRPVFAIY